MKFFNFYSISTILTVIFVFALYSQEDVIETDILTDKINDPNCAHWVSAHPIPDSMSFANEPVPLLNPDIRERLDREILVNTFWQSNAFLLIKRANKYSALIDSVLEKENVPLDFKYLAIIESGLQNVKSPAGAAGFWQFMPSTAKEYGLEVNDNVDERYNLLLATRAATQYLKRAKEELGSWTLAAAAYNAGRAGIRRELDHQKVESYYDLLLNSETSRYVFRILAVKSLIEFPEKYGFRFEQMDLYSFVPVKKLKVDSTITDLVSFSKNFGINYKILKIHNPWLREGHLNNRSKKEYYINIPAGGFYQDSE